MALYRRGTASMDADGTVHGTDTKWKDQLALIRVGATIVFLEQPIKLAVISDIVSDTELKAISTDGQTAADGKYVILLNDSLTVNGLAQNVAETLRYYQSKETEIASALDIIADLDMDNLNNIVQEIKSNKSAAEAAQNQAELARDSANSARDESISIKNDAQAARDAAVSAKDAAAVSAQEAQDAANSVNADNLLTKDGNLSGLADKEQSKKNLAVNRLNQPRGDLTEIYSNDDRTGFKLIVKDSGDWGAMTHDGSENKALGVNFGGTGGTTEEQARTSLKVYKLDRTNLGEKHLDSITGEGDGPGIYMQSSSALATASRGYPEATAGMLEVLPNGANGASACIQRFTPFTYLGTAPESGNSQNEYARAGRGTFYIRMKNGNNAKFSPWIPFQASSSGNVVSSPASNEKSSWVDYVNALSSQPSSLASYNVNSVGWVTAISVRHRNGQGDGSAFGFVIEDASMTSPHYKDVRLRKQTGAGQWQSTQVIWNTGNTTVDSNGFIKRASPIVDIFGNGSHRTNDESEGCTVERISTGEYLIRGCLSLNSDLAWGGVNGGIEIPKDINGQPILWVDYDVNPDGSLVIKTYHRTHDNAPSFARNHKDGYSDGDPIDIPSDVFVSVRVEMPNDSIYNKKVEECKRNHERMVSGEFVESLKNT